MESKRVNSTETDGQLHQQGEGVTEREKGGQGKLLLTLSVKVLGKTLQKDFFSSLFSASFFFFPVVSGSAVLCGSGGERKGGCAP